MFTLKTTVSRWAALAVLGLGLMACGAGTEPEDVSFDITVTGREVLGGTTSYMANDGDTITFNITSDEAASVHVHGYNIEDETGHDGKVSITFEADATGQFPIEMHVGGDHANDETNACNVDATGVAVHLDAEPGEHPGAYVVGVETENFELIQASGNHWHLTANGELIGMYYEPSVEVILGEGMHELVATLSDSNHCELPVSDTAMVGEGEAMNPDGGSHDAEHTHDDEEATISLGQLQILPR